MRKKKQNKANKRKHSQQNDQPKNLKTQLQEKVKTIEPQHNENQSSTSSSTEHEQTESNMSDNENSELIIHQIHPTTSKEKEPNKSLNKPKSQKYTQSMVSGEELLAFFKNELSKGLEELKELYPNISLEDVMTNKRPLSDTTTESTPK